MTSDISITDFVDFNPKRRIQKGTAAPFVDMAALPVDSRDISAIGERVFKGGGSRFMNGDTLFARITPCLENGKTAKVSGLPEKVVASGSTEFIVMAAKEPEYDEDYVYYLARLPEFRAYAQARMEGTSGRQRVPWQSLAGFTFDFPGKEARKVIGRVLKVFDDKIELNRQTNQTLEQMAQAIFKSWFVDFEPTRAKIIAKAQGADPATQELAAQAIISGAITLEQLQGYAEESVEESAQQREQESLSTRLQKAINEKLSQASAHPLNATTAEQLIATAALFPNELVESELGEVPKGWEVKALDEIAHYQNGLALQKFRPENDEESLPVLKIAQLRKGFADDEERASANIKPECIVDNGDVVFSWSGSLIVDIWCGGKVALNQHLFKVTSQNYPKWFYHYWTKRHLEVFQQIAADKAVTMGHIKREHLSQAKCLVPADNLLELGVINNLLEKQVLLNLENFSLENIRDALLPKLLSGELRVNSGSHIT